MTSVIKDLLAGASKYHEDLGVTTLSAPRYSGDTIIPTEVLKLGGKQLNVQLAANLIRKAWVLRNNTKVRAAAKVILMASPLLYPVSTIDVLVSQIEGEGFLSVEAQDLNLYQNGQGSSDQPRGGAPYPNNPGPSPSKYVTSETMEVLSTALQTMGVRDTPPVFADLADTDLLKLFGTVGALPWRSLVKSLNIGTSAWVTSPGGIYNSSLAAIRSLLPVVGDSFDQLVSELQSWFLSQTPQDLLLWPHAAMIIRVFSKQGALIPPYIAASIQSVWRYHGMAPYVLLREVSRVLNSPPVAVLRDSACAPLNSTIIGLLDLMDSEYSDKTGIFPYSKILQPDLFPKAATKVSANFMYWVRQLLQPVDPLDQLPDTGIWQKVCELPGRDIQKFLFEAAVAYRARMLFRATDETSGFMTAIMTDGPTPLIPTVFKLPTQPTAGDPDILGDGSESDY